MRLLKPCFYQVHFLVIGPPREAKSPTNPNKREAPKVHRSSLFVGIVIASNEGKDEFSGLFSCYLFNQDLILFLSNGFPKTNALAISHIAGSLLTFHLLIFPLMTICPKAPLSSLRHQLHLHNKALLGWRHIMPYS